MRLNKIGTPNTEPRTIRMVVIHVLIGLTASVAHADRLIPHLVDLVLQLLKISETS
ncbi:MAG: hypothetical protein HWN80_07255 [Candidatus Lokiarchaeota archaeon]|nr:hypothetical protein [Candidatus Lokiarchaeota archaeon]